MLDEDEKKNLQVVMLTVDPERDTEAKLAAYVPYFNPDFIGVTGNPYQILNLATQLSVVYAKVPTGGNDYTLDHSGNVVIINPRGDYHGFFRPPFGTYFEHRTGMLWGEWLYTNGASGVEPPEFAKKLAADIDAFQSATGKAR